MAVPRLAAVHACKGGGNERLVAASQATFRQKLSNEINSFLLCMGLFSIFLSGRPS